MVQVCNKRDTSDGVYIGRGSPLGNPFRIGSDGDRDEVIEKYRHYITKELEAANPIILAALLSINDDDRLICYCAPKACHGHVIADILPSVRDYIPAPAALTYAGIGSRPESFKKPNGLPRDKFDLIKRLSGRMAAHGFTLRSGRADGCDLAFELGADKKEIFLPWNTFWNDFNTYEGLISDGDHSDVSVEAINLANIVYHGDLTKAKQSIQKLMGRNSYQILGLDLRSPVEMVICWTADGCESRKTRTRATGGTGQAIALADLFGIPVYNLRNPDAMTRLADHVKRLTSENRLSVKKGVR